MSMEENNPTNREKQEIERNPDGTYKPGVSGNINGRPRDTLKAYMSQKLRDMSDEEKEEFLKGIAKEIQWKMGEGNPATETDITTKGEKIMYMPSEIIAKNEIPRNTESSSEEQEEI